MSPVPELPSQLSLVSYAVNGSGLGHLVRQIAIHRWLRRYTTFAGVRAQHWFITTSEADTWLFHEGFAGFKLPSKSVIEESGAQKLAYLALAKQWVWHSLALLRPDLLIVDTFPNGSFGELLGALDLCRHRALVLRPVKEAWADQPGFRAMVGLYDRVVVPADADDFPGFAARFQIEPSRLAMVGPIFRAEDFELLPRAEARRRIGVPEGATCLLVSGGGGGDATVDRLFDRVQAALADDPEVFLVLAAGPLYRGPARRGPRTIWWTTPDLALHLRAFDGAVAAGGFNSVHELLHAGVPALFVPQEKIADDQAARVDALVAAHAALRADLGDEAALRAGLRALRDPAHAAALRAAAQARVPRSRAREAALALLDLLLPQSVLRQAEAAVDDDLLRAAQAEEVPLEALCDLAAALHGPRRDIDRAALDLDPALEIIRAARRHRVPVPSASRIAGLLARKLRGPRPAGADAVADAVLALVEHPAAREQHAAVAMILGALTGERDLAPVDLAERLCDLLARALARGRDGFAIARMIAEEADQGAAEGTSNAPLFARLHARLAAAEAPA